MKMKIPFRIILVILVIFGLARCGDDPAILSEVDSKIKHFEASKANMDTLLIEIMKDVENKEISTIDILEGEFRYYQRYFELAMEENGDIIKYIDSQGDNLSKNNKDEFARRMFKTMKSMESGWNSLYRRLFYKDFWGKTQIRFNRY